MHNEQKQECFNPFFIQKKILTATLPLWDELTAKIEGQILNTGADQYYSTKTNSIL